MSPRESIRMSAAEVDEFLTTRRHAVLATIGPRGAPDVSIVPHEHRDGMLVLTVGEDEPARGAIAADDRVCCAFETCPSYYEIRGVSIHGRAEAVDGGRVRVHAEHTTSFDFAKIRERPA
jgi:hypothetical protein